MSYERNAEKLCRQRGREGYSQAITIDDAKTGIFEDGIGVDITQRGYELTVSVPDVASVANDDHLRVQRGTRLDLPIKLTEAVNFEEGAIRPATKIRTLIDANTGKILEQDVSAGTVQILRNYTNRGLRELVSNGRYSEEPGNLDGLLSLAKILAKRDKTLAELAGSVVQKCMIIANQVAAQELYQKGLPAGYRARNKYGVSYFSDPTRARRYQENGRYQIEARTTCPIRETMSAIHQSMLTAITNGQTIVYDRRFFDWANRSGSMLKGIDQNRMMNLNPKIRSENSELKFEPRFYETRAGKVGCYLYVNYKATRLMTNASGSTKKEALALAEDRLYQVIRKHTR